MVGNSQQNRAGAKDEVNVQVLLRCRPPSTEEQEAGVPEVVTCCEQHREVVFNQNVAGKEISRTFTFDKVFGPESCQEDLFNQAVAPIVDEVLEGFNCTIFAYGQTGTGKTYTMEGGGCCGMDGKSLAPQAGLIPRAVKRIFDVLDGNQADSSVRVSFLELYNEELTDLLDVGDDGFRQKLRIMDDHKNGNVVHGLEDCIVRNAAEIYQVLERGSAKRRTAETQLNKRSSRSHSIFSITIHIKEEACEGEDVIKTGKLNLVDLAGSENISRSGAKEGRAREAGSINQSLLTLGRVITALVEHSGHIPYRDSKLTRLLRDSLGGRTKTCIIATVSPTSDCQEESLSTLDYAHRAKNIRNRPEINQRISKTAMIRELNAEIERLREELLAQRTKNGVFIPVETYKRTEEDQVVLHDKIQRMKTEQEGTYQEMQELREEFTKREKERDTKELQLQSHILSLKEELNTAKHRLEEERLVTSVLRQSEEALANHGLGLTEEVHRLAEVVEVLFTKVDCFAALDSTNRALSQELKELVTERLSSLTSSLQAMIESHRNHSGNVIRMLQDMDKKRAIEVNAGKDMLENLHSKADNIRQNYSTALNELHSAGNITAQKIAGSAQTCADETEKTVNDLTVKSQQTFDDLTGNLSAHLEELKKIESGKKSQVDDIVSAARSGCSEVKSRLSGVKRSADELCTTFKDGIKDSEKVLDSLAMRYEESLAKKGQELISSMSQTVTEMMSSFAAEVKQTMDNAKDKVTAKQKQGVETCSVHLSRIGHIIDQVQENDDKIACRASTYFQELPENASTFATSIEKCSEIGKQQHSLSQHASKDLITVATEHLNSVLTTMSQGHQIADRIVNQAHVQALSSSKALSETRSEFDMQIDSGFEASKTAIDNVAGMVHEGHQLVSEYGDFHTRTVETVGLNVKVVVEEKLQWDDGATRLPDRHEDDLPAKEFIHKLRAPSRQALRDAKQDGQQHQDRRRGEATAASTSISRALSCPLKLEQDNIESRPSPAQPSEVNEHTSTIPNRGRSTPVVDHGHFPMNSVGIESINMYSPLVTNWQTRSKMPKPIEAELDSDDMIARMSKKHRDIEFGR